LGKLIKTIATSASLSFFFCLGCGSNLTQQIAQPATTPSITQVLPQTIPAGSQTQTLKVTGTNFPSQAAILWNGTALATTVVDSNTLSGTIGSSSLTTPTTVQLQVQNTQTMQASQAVPVVIAADATNPTPAALAIGTSSLPQGVVGTGYNGVLAATGGTAPYTWSITSGQLQAGLSLSTSGIISGTPTAGGSANFTVKLTDSSSTPQTASAALVLTVNAAPVTVVPLTISTSTLPAGTIGSGYSTLLQASGGTSPYLWSVTSGSLPAGLSLTSATGIISGYPTSAGTANFTATVADAENPAQTKSVALSITVAPVTLTIVSTTLPAGTQGSGYSRTLQANGGTAPYTWSLTSGALPAGLTLAANGVVSGTPTASGNFTIGVTLKDAGSPAQTATATVTLTVVAQGTPLAISSSTLPSGMPNQTYSAVLNATGGTAPYTWSLTSGTLPAGLSLAATTGVISGTPTTSGTSSLTFKVTDSSNPAQTQSVTLSLVIASTPLVISTSSVPSGTKGTAYSSLLQVSGGSVPYTWSITTGSLPAGLTLSSTTGLISGTPTATGTSTFTATAKDAGSPAQTKSVSLSIAVAAPAPPPLTITTSSLPSGTKSTAYSTALLAGGGTPSYSWSITGGSLPAGLTLSTTGAITGTPTASGTGSFTATVTDSGSPAQTKSISLSIVIAAPAAPATLTINASLPAATNGTAYSSAMTATGGTPAYTWSITGTLPPGLTLAATTGVISGTPTTNGTYNFTATVSDNGSPVQTQSAATSIVVATASVIPPGPGTTWYVRPDGGTRYSANAPTGQCDGKADVAYSGSGTNQHCAFNDYRFLYDDQSSQNVAWVIAGGDTVILRGGPWRVGVNQGTVAKDVWCNGSTTLGNPYNCTNPTIPAGTATQHTRILGENYGSCSQSNMTQLYGGFGVVQALRLDGAQYVDVQCIELTRHSQCTFYGVPAYPANCSRTYPLDDYATNGMTTTNTTHDVLLQDMWIHGFMSRGIIGPIGGTVSATRVDIAYNGGAGWDFDDGSATPSVNAVVNFSYLTVEWSGCNQAYPGTGAVSCYSQSTGGYGDGIGTPAGTCLSANVDHSIFRYNTQDGYDMLHNDTGNCYGNITDSASYGNNGAQFKWGPNDNPMVFTNNTVVANCMRLSAPFPGQPSTYNANLADFCRAGDAMAFGFRDGGSTTMENNTFVSYAPTTFDASCSGTYPQLENQGTCNNSTFTFENNITYGIDNPDTYNDGGQVGGPGGFYYGTPIGHVIRNNNLYFGLRATSFICPTGLPAEICADPLFVNEPVFTGESSLDNFNFNITPGSPAVGAGIFIPSLTLDYSGATRPNPPSLGALEP
jgi:hypothetical protein